jgi:hypothetical protein
MKETWLVVASITMSTLLIIAVVWQAFKTWHVRIDGRREAEYHKLAEQLTEVMRKQSEQLAEISDTTAELRRRLTTIETVLKEVG